MWIKVWIRFFSLLLFTLWFIFWFCCWLSSIVRFFFPSHWSSELAIVFVLQCNAVAHTETLVTCVFHCFYVWRVSCKQQIRGEKYEFRKKSKLMNTNKQQSCCGRNIHRHGECRIKRRNDNFFFEKPTLERIFKICVLIGNDKRFYDWKLCEKWQQKYYLYRRHYTDRSRCWFFFFLIIQ